MRYSGFTVILSGTTGAGKLNRLGGAGKVNGWYYHGAAAVKSLFKDLHYKHGLANSTSPELVILCASPRTRAR